MDFSILHTRSQPAMSGFRFRLVFWVILLIGFNHSKMAPICVSADQPSLPSFRPSSTFVSPTDSPPCEIRLNNAMLYADCEGRHLKTVPDYLPDAIIELDLSNNDFASLNSTSFASLPLLEVIILTKNKIVTIDNDTFSSLPQLRSVMLDLNDLRQLPNRIFSRNKRLDFIDLSHNYFPDVPVNVIGQHNKLSRFVFNHNNITKFKFTGSPQLDIEYIQLWGLNISSVCSDDFTALSSSTIHAFSLRYNNLTTLPDNVFQNLKSVENLDLQYNSIAVFNLNSLNSMKSLRAVSVFSNNISSIDILKNITNVTLIPPLENLTISKNFIKTVSSGTFVHLTRLEYIDLSRNHIHELSNDSFECLVNLQYLDLSWNSLKNISAKTFSDLKSLRTVKLANNKFVILNPANFSGITPLTFLDLSFNQIERIEAKTPWKLPFLDTLDLTRNNFDSLIGHPFRGFIDLKCLILSENPVQKLGDNAFVGLSSITDLRLSKLGKIQNINNPFNYMSTLESFDLSHTNFGDDLHIFSGLSSLTTLNIAYSSMTADRIVSKNRSLLCPLGKLQVLKLRGNSLNSMQPGTFCALPNLRILYLSKCQIIVLHPDIFVGLPELRTLDLGQNNIQFISAEHLRGVPLLTILLFKLNQLKGVVDQNLFTGQTNLTVVDLTQNAITGFTENTYLPIRTLILAGNPMSCECDLQWFRRYIDQSSLVLEKATQTFCSENSIPALSGKPYLTFQPDQVCGPRIVLYVGTSLGICLCVLLTVLAYHSRWWLNYKCFNLKLLVVGYYEIEDLRDHHDYEFDLNIIFPDVDEKWVTGEFIKCVEQHLPEYERQRIVCGADELPLGGTRLDAIDSVIKNSFKTLVVVSLASVHDAHFMTQLRMAVEHMNEVQLEKVVLVFREDIPDNQLPYLVRLFLSKNKPYFRWSDDMEGQIYFWQKLTKVLRVNKKMNSLLPL